MVINPLILYSAGGALLVGLLGGWMVRDWKADSDQLAAVGFTTDVPGDAPALVTDTIIYDVNGHPQQAAQIAKIIPGRVVTGPLPTTIQSSADIVIVVGSDNVNP